MELKINKLKWFNRCDCIDFLRKVVSLSFPQFIKLLNHIEICLADPTDSVSVIFHHNKTPFTSCESFLLEIACVIYSSFGITNFSPHNISVSLF